MYGKPSYRIFVQYVEYFYFVLYVLQATRFW